MDVDTPYFYNSTQSLAAFNLPHRYFINILARSLFHLAFVLYLPSLLDTSPGRSLRQVLDGRLNSRLVTKQHTKAAKASMNTSIVLLKLAERDRVRL